MTGKNLGFGLAHTTTDKAATDFAAPLGKIKSTSSYWKANRVSHNIVDYKLGGERSIKSLLGGDIIFSALSEINFWKYNNARYAIESMIGRIKSRFQHARPYFGLLILDSSPADSGISVVNDFLAENPDIYSVEMAIWQAKGHKGDYFREGEFFVFIGDASNDPFILKDGQTIENLPAEFDKDKVIRVPEELRMEFTLNLERALRDQAGITATGFAGTFFKDKKRLSDAFNLPSHNNDVISVDFYDHSDRLMDYLSMSIRNIPKEKIIYLGVDIGLTNDLTGLTIGYFDEHVVPFPDKPSFTEPSFVINTVCGISRSEQELMKGAFLY
jgi:hypothetical protein